MELTRLRRAVAITVVEIKPHRWCWKVFEVLRVEPVLPEKPLLVPYDSMWRRFAEFKSVADSLQTRSESFNLLLLARGNRLQFLHFIDRSVARPAADGPNSRRPLQR
jgi:hypothetical protein